MVVQLPEWQAAMQTRVPQYGTYNMASAESSDSSQAWVVQLLTQACFSSICPYNRPGTA